MSSTHFCRGYFWGILRFFLGLFEEKTQDPLHSTLMHLILVRSSTIGSPSSGMGSYSLGDSTRDFLVYEGVGIDRGLTFGIIGAWMG